METVYFVRHAQPNYNNHDDKTRELTEKGLTDRQLVTRFLMDKNIQAILSSPYQRCTSTIAEFAQATGLTVALEEGFRERAVGLWVEDFAGFAQKQWADFSYKLNGGECLSQVQARNISALERALNAYPNQNIVISGHGTAICTVLNYYNPSFGYEDFERIRPLMPWAVTLQFQNKRCISIQECPLAPSPKKAL